MAAVTLIDARASTSISSSGNSSVSTKNHRRNLGLMASLHRKRWLCQLCNKNLSSKRSYTEHQYTHSKLRPFQCESCTYAAASNMTLRRHVLRHHAPRQSWGYQCPYCSEGFVEPASYQMHVVSHHRGCSATLGCPSDNCRFVSKSSRHFRQHLEKHVYKPPPTASCGDSTAVQATLKWTLPESVRQAKQLLKFTVDDDLGQGYAARQRSEQERRARLEREKTFCKARGKEIFVQGGHQKLIITYPNKNEPKDHSSTDRIGVLPPRRKFTQFCRIGMTQRPHNHSDLVNVRRPSQKIGPVLYDRRQTQLSKNNYQAEMCPLWKHDKSRSVSKPVVIEAPSLESADDDYADHLVVLESTCAVHEVELDGRSVQQRLTTVDGFVDYDVD